MSTRGAYRQTHRARASWRQPLSNFPTTQNARGQLLLRPCCPCLKAQQPNNTMSKEGVEAVADAMKAQNLEEAAGGKYDRWNLRHETDVKYGLFGAKGEYNRSSEGGYYITTAINYTNGPAHMGHAYEATTADALARYARVRGGRDGGVQFVTGTDEHGEKIAKTAAENDSKPIELCNKYVTGFQCLNQRILISNDDYIRTTSERHAHTAQALWKRCADAGDIYLDSYSGWYNVREETFVTDSDAQLADYKDPVSGKPLKKVEEASYFFKMSNFHDRLVQHIKDNPEFIRPEQHRNQILTRLADDRLRDLSISRTSFDWGIPVPEGFDDKHVMYVWFDALSNYLTGVDALGANEPDAGPNDLAKYWPADVHIIGKDILWFHTVIWPTILMSAGLPLPKTVFAHGFVNDKEGKKMSKSLGNVVDPHDMLDKYPVDIFRWYLCKEAPYGGELSFSEDSLRDMHNSDLCDTLGNLVHRGTNLCKKYCGGSIPDVPAPPSSPIDFYKVRETYQAKMDNFELEGGAAIVMQAFRDVNGYLTEEAPWLKKGDEFEEERKIVVRATLEAIYALAHLLLPFIPAGATKIFEKLNTSPTFIADIDADLRNLEAGAKVEIGDVLFKKIMSDEELSAADIKKKKNEDYEEAQRRKKEKKAAQFAKSKAAQAGSDQADFTKVDIRVGKITKVWHHPEAGKLFCEEIDIGEEGGPRQIASGLRANYELGDMQDKKVLVVCNLKASKMVGFESQGMVLAAKSEDGSKVELVTPPDDAVIGERVFIEGLSGDPFSSTQMKKKKVWDKVAKKFQTGDGGVATWDGKEIKTSSGACVAATLVGAPIS